MARIAGQRSMQVLHAVAGRTHAATLIMDDRHETVDTLIARQDDLVGLLGDCAADGGGTVDAGDDADEIAGRGATVGTAVAHEGARPVGAARRFRRHRRADRQPVLIEGQIVGMNVFARSDLDGCPADRLAVFHHRLADMDGMDRHLVAGIDPAIGAHATRQFTARLNGQRCNGDIVVRRQNDEGRCGHPWYLPGRFLSE